MKRKRETLRGGKYAVQQSKSYKKNHIGEGWRYLKNTTALVQRRYLQQPTSETFLPGRSSSHFTYPVSIYPKNSMYVSQRIRPTPHMHTSILMTSMTLTPPTGFLCSHLEVN